MPDADRLLREYVEAFERDGYADPREFVARAEGGERARLASLIDGYLEHAAPRRDWDPEGFEGSLAERAVSRATESWAGAAGELSRELVGLRNKRKITRAQLTAKLADWLGFPERREKVAAYYHRLERGTLPADEISPKVFTALGELLQTDWESLRRLSLSSWSHSESAGEAPVFARKGWVDPRYGQASPGRPDEAPGAPSPGREPADWDEVDELFAGAGEAAE